MSNADAGLIQSYWNHGPVRTENSFRSRNILAG